jgi:hypothetical protein
MMHQTRKRFIFYALFSLMIGIALNFAGTPVYSQSLEKLPAPVAPAALAERDAQAGQYAQAGPRQFLNRFNLAPDTSKPVEISGNVRRPFLFFRDSINRPWKPIRLFLLMVTFAALVGNLAPGAVRASAYQCRTNFFGALASAFLFTVLFLGCARFAFQNEALVPLALLSIGIVQLGYIIGMGLGINVIAQVCYARLTDKKESFSALGQRLTRAFLLIAISTGLTVLSLLGDIGRLPRLGNRLVILVAIIGLGGLVASLYSRYRNESANESIAGS